MFCDITVRTNGQSYAAHRVVLAAVSDHFQEVFTEMDSSMKTDIDLTGKSKYSQRMSHLHLNSRVFHKKTQHMQQF